MYYKFKVEVITMDNNKNKLSNHDSSTEDDICDIFENKICDNCCKCLESKESDVRSINIEDVDNYILEGETFNENLVDLKYESNENDSNFENINDTYVQEVDNKKVYFIEDLESVKNVLDNESDFDSLASEAYPGLIILKGKE